MDVLLDNSDVFLDGFGTTVLLFLCAALLSIAVGLSLGAMRVSPIGVLRATSVAYVTLVRNTPLTLLMFFFVFGYPKLGLPDLDYFSLAVVALGLYTASYVAEVVRAGVNTVPPGQAEAARALGFTFGQSMTSVILPQALRAVSPPMVSVLIALLKNTTIAAGFSVAEAGAIRATLSERGEPALPVMLWVACGFVVLVMLLSLLQRTVERRWSIAR